LKYLVAGLGNIGDEYLNTRHNIGFSILDAWAKASNISFSDHRYGFISKAGYRGRSFVLLKPSTYMNLSGNAVNYWLKKEKIPVENLLVVVDDVSLPFGSIRLRPGGGDGGHNGLFHINSVLGHANYARLRFEIGSRFSEGRQVEYVLGEWAEDEREILNSRIELAVDMIKSFGFVGVELTMTRFNKKASPGDDEEQ